MKNGGKNMHFWLFFLHTIVSLYHIILRKKNSEIQILNYLLYFLFKVLLGCSEWLLGG